MTEPEKTCDDPSVLFETARKLEGAERQAYLDRACQSNPSLKANIESMIDAHAKQGEFLADPTADVPSCEIDAPGSTIGPYKLLQKIGEGGMGVVYMAEQRSPVRRRVALKIIKPGMDTKQVIARFEAERQALAMLDHPNIAKVHDAGATKTGRPYFVMELINGVPLTEYCDEHSLNLEERLRLFIPVCSAVQHSHQKGIIHRDLKPSNVLATEYDHDVVPKVIDFGVAKATNQTLTEKTMYTQFGQIVGTMEYMSPEQAKRNQLDIDTRSDIYSLGVVLYELLTGETPFDRKRLRSSALDEMLRIIREEEPPPPSSRLSTSQTIDQVARHRRTDPTKLTGLIRGELDWIVMRSLDKDRNRRYPTAISFAEDLQNYLDGRTVSACPPSLAYRCSKFARRNKTAMATVGAFLLSVILGLVGTTWFAITEIQQRQEKELALEKAQTILFDHVLMYAISGDVEAVERLLKETTEVELDPALRDLAMGVAYCWAVDFDKATEWFDKAKQHDGYRYAISAASIQASGNKIYEQIQELGEPSEPLDYIYQIQVDSWVSPARALAARENTGHYRGSRIEQFLSALAEVNNALLTQNMEQADDAVKTYDELLKWYPGNKVQLCAQMYAAVAALNIARSKGLTANAQKYEALARRLAGSLEKHNDIFWVARTRAWFFAECGDGGRAVGEWDQRMGRPPLSFDPMQYAAYKCLFEGDGGCRDALDELPEAFDVTNGYSYLAEAYLLAQLQEPPDAIAEACKRAIEFNPRNLEIQCGAVEVWLVARDYARACRQAERLLAQKPSGMDRRWESILRFIVNPDDKDLREVPLEPNSFMFNANADYYVALKAYAHGNMQKARSYFKKCSNSGRFIANWYWWSKALLAQMPVE